MKRLIGLLTIQLYVVSLLVPSAAHAAPVLPITAPSAVLLDYSTNKIIYAKTPHLKRAPASTTKILTALVAVENLDLNKVVTIPGFVNSIEPSKAHLRPGEKYYVRDLVRAALISSANDAAEVVAHYGGGGSRAAFANLMNRKMRQIGAHHSNFVRASGLPAKNQYSTAYDMALVMREARKYPFIVEAMKIKVTTIRSLSGRPTIIRNHNKMLWQDGRRVLGKTGWTRNARHCFVGLIDTPDRDVFVSMLGSKKLWKDLKKLANYPKSRSEHKISGKTSSGQSESKREKNIRIQKALRKAGFFKGPLNGVYGPMTRKAVRKFQKAHGIRQTGTVGPKTTRKLQVYF